MYHITSICVRTTEGGPPGSTALCVVATLVMIVYVASAEASCWIVAVLLCRITLT